MKFESIVNHYEYAPSMRKEQQGDNKTKEIGIIQDNAIWKVINRGGRTLDANAYQGRGRGKCGHTRTLPRVWRALAINAAEDQRDVASHLADASNYSGQ